MSSRPHWTIIAAAALAVAIGQGTGAALAQDAEQAIREGSSAFVEAYKTGDGAEMAALYTEDGSVLAPEAPIARGRDQVAAFWQGAMDAGIDVMELRPREIVEDGDHAYEVGEATLELPVEGGSTLTSTIKYLVVWQRGEDGTWRLHRDIWNAAVEG